MSNPVIIDEFLTFCQNKIDVMDELSVVQICATNFTDAEIESGKSTLFDALSNEGVKLIQRKGEDKRKKNIKDVLKVFKETDPKLQPTFVAKDLNRLPPVTFDHVDVTRLLKDLVILKTELQFLRAESVSKTQIEELKTSIISEVCTRVTTTNSNKKSTKSGPNASQNTIDNAKSNRSEKRASTNSGSESANRSKDVPITPPPAPMRKRSDSLDTIVSPPSYRNITERPKRHANNNVNDAGHSDQDDTNGDFKIVINRKKQRSLRNKNKCGTASGPSRLQVAELPEAIYLSRLKNTCNVDDVIDHIQSKGAQAIDVQLLTQKKQLEFRSFKILVAKQNLDTFLSTDFWPTNLVFRRSSPWQSNSIAEKMKLTLVLRNQ
ncbi:hypothetical protein NE865_15206 [Phthorimaea operculella]|nr:hypothetical protein NE865_15206 [Phthorimaea operculella]